MSALDNPIAFLKAMLPRVPLIAKTILLHGMGLSPVSGKQDLRTELTVAIIRSFMKFRSPISKAQKGSMRDPGIQGPMWVSHVTMPQPEDDVQDAVVKAIEELKLGEETFDIPGVAPVEAEWTGYRSGVGKREPQPEISEEEKYKELRKEATADSVVLYFHGGAYFLMDPCTHRVPVAQISKRTGAPVLSVRYRLAPQHPFPAALVDALASYLSLIHPPAGSFHDPVPANKIILAGDSAGGNLSLVLLQTLMTLRRISPSVRFHGKEVPIDLPAGVATMSPWCDITRSMPSVVRNSQLDYLSPPSQEPETMYLPLPVPADDIWPCDPPRVDIYCNGNAASHPLVSPLAIDKNLWKDAPPVLISVGEEGLSDEGLIVARKMHHAGVPVVIEQFEGMPHCFGLLMVNTPLGKRFMTGVERFVRAAVAGQIKGSSSGNATYVGFKLRYEREIPLGKLVEVSDEEAHERLRRSTYWRMEGEKALRKEKQERARL